MAQQGGAAMNQVLEVNDGTKASKLYDMGLRIEYMRERRGFSANDLVTAARATGWPARINTPGSILSMKSARKLLSVPALAAVAEALGTSADYLIGLTDDPGPPPGQIGEIVFNVEDEADRHDVRFLVEAFLAMPDGDRRTLLGVAHSLSTK